MTKQALPLRLQLIKNKPSLFKLCAMLQTDQPQKKYSLYVVHLLFSLFVVCSSLWLSFAIWFQQPFGKLGSLIVIGVWIFFSASILGLYATHFISRRKDILIYLIIFGFGLIWYFSLTAQQDRNWNPEVAQQLHYEKHGDFITLHNVRNFDWHADGRYTERWETRQFDLKQITGVNVLTSYWMGPQIAHTLVSFDFKDTAPLTFSIEIRKEKHEEFSTLGGFFRKYELSLIAADEKDIVYTRSNIRGEQVYFFPIQLPQAQQRALFEEYLRKADALQQQAKWYNTLTSNCTTLVFDMAQAISQKPLPSDYRLLASGYLPNYLYDLQALDPKWNIQKWYKNAHINPKVSHQSFISSQQYSQLIRQGLDQP